MSPLLRLYRRLLIARHPLAIRLRARLAERLRGNLYRVPYLEGEVRIDPTENIGYHVLLSGRYEPNIVSIVQAWARDGFSYVDVGANIGLHLIAAAFARRSPAQRLIGFEPEPGVFRHLQENCALNGLEDIDLHPVGIGAEPGSVTLYRSTEPNEGNHALIPRPGTEAAGEVAVETLDRLLPSLLPPEAPVLVKVDVEGYEPLVLRGAETWLSATRPAVVIMEISPTLLHSQGWSEGEIRRRLHRYGFRRMRIIHDSDTFFGDGRLINDYFNILCWKGDEAEAVYRQLPPRFFLTEPPANAPDFVDWSSFSTE